MKYIKLFMLLAVTLPFFTSCSEDEDVNTMQCTVGFESAAVEIDETSGLVQIPIAVSGHRNGPVRVTIEAAPVGENGAVEGTNYMITDKTLNLNSDTLNAGTMNVEVKVIDDTQINEDRQFTLTITSAEGAEVTIQQTTVTISDNDGDFYRAFAGTWTFSATSLASGSQVSFPITISAAAEGSEDYEKVLSVEASNILGYGEAYSWNFEYSFDVATMSGSLGFPCGDIVCNLQNVYLLTWLFNPAGDENLYEGTLPIEWSLTEEGTIPNTLSLDPSYALYLYAMNPDGSGVGYMDAFVNVTLTRN